MPLTQQEIKSRAYAFVKEWEATSRERAEAQTFWNDFFDIFGISRRRVASFEEPVKKLGEARGSIDLFWKGTLLVEHKSKGRDLSKAYQQALDYFPGISEQDLPQYVLVSDFSDFRLYDLDAGGEVEFTLNELPEKIHLFGFISGYKSHAHHEEDAVNIRAAEKMGELHDELLKSGYSGHALEVFLVRLVYVLFADDTGIFPRDHFHYFLENRANPNGFDTGSTLALIFQTLNTPNEKRQNTDEELLQFPYVNGGLFEETLPIAGFNQKMRQTLLDCCSFDWSKVSPAIFGSLFQSVMDKQQRREIGAHYTSEKNILKVARPLFLDELRAEFESARNSQSRLKQLHDKIAAMRFFDPACGCGNFLIITYRELRRLEIEILVQQRKLSTKKDAQQLVIEAGLLSRIDVDALYGIELEEFPARIAEVALWLTDHQMNMELSQEFGQTYIRLPLKKSANIQHGNALQLPWDFVPKASLTILGNPPFIGKNMRNAEQNVDMEIICPMDNYSILDYVTAWYIKSTQFIKDTNIKVAFVSTNSITQGEQVGALWNWMLAQGVKIHFAHRTFRWVNDARGKAAVFCVIIGFGLEDVSKKRLFDYASPGAEVQEIQAGNISPYLLDTENILIQTRNKPLCEVPEMTKGSQPTDEGNLLFSDEEKTEFLKKEPAAKKYIRQILGSQEFLHNEKRWCLWLKDISPVELRSLPEVMKRVNAVREFRLKSSKAATVKFAGTPYLFTEIRQPESNYLIMPLVSSENRVYVPTGFLSKEIIATNLASIIPNATLYHFGVISSMMHMAWMRAVCGRLEGRYRYSNNIVYNNFPWAAGVSEKQKIQVEKCAQEVLDARKQFPDSSLADLYDPSATPKVLVEAHRALDKAVDSCYRREPFKSELERLEFLFALYRQYTEPLNVVMKGKKKERKTK